MHFAKHFIYLRFIEPQEVLLLSPFYKEEASSEKVSYLSKGTELVNSVHSHSQSCPAPNHTVLYVPYRTTKFPDN
jgi:hypothetical protein